MAVRVQTVAFDGSAARPVEVQVQLASGLPNLMLVGLPDKAVSEAKERVRAALSSMGLALPPKRITINLAPADRPKEGSHFDLPIILGVMLAMDLIDPVELDRFVVMGELALDGAIAAVPGALPAGLYAAESGRGLICPAENGPEAAWANPSLPLIGARHVLELMNHLKGEARIEPPEPAMVGTVSSSLDLREIKGQEQAKRALEVAAAGAHTMLMLGPPGSGKSMLAARLPGILPPLDPREALDVAMIRSMAGVADEAVMTRVRPFRNPHHSASMAALIGGGLRVKPGEVSLAHRGVLFLDELPEFSRPVLDSLRQPIETGEAVVSRANRHVSFPARFQLIAAMNPCRCGHLMDPAQSCTRAPLCAEDYQKRISGPLLDRMDIQIEVPPVPASALGIPAAREGSQEVGARVAAARAIQKKRYEGTAISTNAEADGAVLEDTVCLSDAGQKLLIEASEKLRLTARGYHRVLRVARTLADLAHRDEVSKSDIAEAVTYRHRKYR